MRIVVGITGATGAVYGVRALEMLRELGVETHLCVSHWGRKTLEHELNRPLSEVRELATHAYAPGDVGAAISSGSFLTDGMLIAPCSMKSIGQIANGVGDNLVSRAADVVLKERRKLVLVAREAPLSEIHLTNMLTLARMGAVIVPPVPAFYNHPQTVEDLVDHTVVRALDQFGLHAKGAKRWAGRLLRAPARGAAIAEFAHD